MDVPPPIGLPEKVTLMFSEPVQTGTVIDAVVVLHPVMTDLAANRA